MSEKEKQMAEGIAKLPEKLQEKFLDQITGAAMTVDLLMQEREEKETETVPA